MLPAAAVAVALRGGGAAPLLGLFARLFLLAPFVSEPAPARPTPISLASCCRLAVAVVFRRSASRIPSSYARRSLRRAIISQTLLRWPSGVPVVALSLSL